MVRIFTVLFALLTLSACGGPSEFIVVGTARAAGADGMITVEPRWTRRLTPQAKLSFFVRTSSHPTSACLFATLLSQTFIQQRRRTPSRVRRFLRSHARAKVSPIHGADRVLLTHSS